MAPYPNFEASVSKYKIQLEIRKSQHSGVSQKGFQTIKGFLTLHIPNKWHVFPCQGTKGLSNHRKDDTTCISLCKVAGVLHNPKWVVEINSSSQSPTDLVTGPVVT